MKRKRHTLRLDRVGEVSSIRGGMLLRSCGTDLDAPSRAHRNDPSPGKRPDTLPKYPAHFGQSERQKEWTGEGFTSAAGFDDGLGHARRYARQTAQTPPFACFRCGLRLTMTIFFLLRRRRFNRYSDFGLIYLPYLSGPSSLPRAFLCSSEVGGRGIFYPT